MTLLLRRRTIIAEAAAGGPTSSLPVTSGLHVHYAADEITGLVDLDPVATWPDRSGNGRDATQGTAANRPVYRTAQLNGLPVVRFTRASSHRLVTAAFTSLPQPNTTFVVAKPGTVGAIQVFFNGIAAGSRHQDYLDTSGRRILFAGSNLGPPAGDLRNAWRLLSAVWNTTTEGWLRGVSTHSGSAGTNPLTGITLGSDVATGGSSYLDGDIAEFVLYDRALTTTERQDVENHLISKWALP